MLPGGAVGTLDQGRLPGYSARQHRCALIEKHHAVRGHRFRIPTVISSVFQLNFGIPCFTDHAQGYVPVCRWCFHSLTAMRNEK